MNIKEIFKTTLVACAIMSPMVSFNSNAAPDSDGFYRTKLDLACTADTWDHLAAFSEERIVPLATGVSKLHDGIEVVVLASKESGRYIVLFYGPSSQHSCFVDMGNKFGPVKKSGK